MMTDRSRYRNGVTAWVDHPVQGRVQVVHLRPLVWTNYPYVEHSATTGETFDHLAYEMYGDPTAYWFIAELNPRVVHPDDLVAGTLVYVPTEKMQ